LRAYLACLSSAVHSLPSIATHQGTLRCATAYYGAPLDTHNQELLVAAKGCTACPFGGTSSPGESAITGCTPAVHSLASMATYQGTLRCATAYYGAPLDANDAEIDVATQGCTACPFGGTSTAGANAAITTCNAADPRASYVDSAGTTVCAVNYYGAPKLLVAAKGCTACPFGGTSSAGETAITGCAPTTTGNVGINVVTAGGTSVCAANYYGAPKDASGVELAVASQGCTQCPTNSVSTAGTTTLAGCTVSAGFYIQT
jgi:hypothetical protein